MVETARMLRKALLICGILSSPLCVGTYILAGMLWEGYSFTDQAVSELSTIDAPTRPLVVPLYLVYDVLMIAFGLGVWGYGRKRALRLTGGLLGGIGVLGFVGVPFPLQLGVAEATFTNTMHSILAGRSIDRRPDASIEGQGQPRSIRPSQGNRPQKSYIRAYTEYRPCRSPSKEKSSR